MSYENDLRQAIKERDDFINAIKAAAHIYGVIVAVDGPHAVVSMSGTIIRCNNWGGFSIGRSVVLDGDTKQIVEAAEYITPGPIAVVTEVNVGSAWYNYTNYLVTVNGLERSVNSTETYKKGDKVVLDLTGQIILFALQQSKLPFTVSSTRVTWDDIGGNALAKATFQEAIELARGDNSVYNMFGIPAPKGILLSGPPGCGKTMLGKAAATELAGSGDGAFMYVKATELLSSYVGESEARIRSVFNNARRYKEETGQPALIFFDEAEAMMSRRGSGISSDVEKTIVPTFLTEMDGMEESAALVVLATNRPDKLDEAIIREGRIDRRVEVARPELPEVIDIYEAQTRDIPHMCDDHFTAIATKTFASPLSSRISGALCQSIVDRTKMVAAKRYIADKSSPRMLTHSDFNNAIDMAINEAA